MPTQERFKAYKNVLIEKADFYAMDVHNKYAKESIDILHIDIANTGETYEFAFDNLWGKVRAGGLMMFEGGMEERDNVGWMAKYEKKKMNPVLMQKRAEGFDIKIVEKFPSMTFVRKPLLMNSKA